MTEAVVALLIVTVVCSGLAWIAVRVIRWRSNLVSGRCPRCGAPWYGCEPKR